MRKRRIIDIPFIIAIIIIVFIVIPTGCIQAYFTYHAFLSDVESMKSGYVASKKEELMVGTNNLLSFLEYYSNHTDQNARNSLKSRVEFILSLLENIETGDPSFLKNPQRTGDLIELLRGMEFRKPTGDFYIFSRDGTGHLFPLDPAVEGKKLMDIKDPEGRFIVREMIELADRNESGFYTYSWPVSGEMRETTTQMVFVQYFNSLDWIIGSGSPLSEIEKESKTELIHVMKHLNLLPDESHFILEPSGRIISGILPEVQGKDNGQIAQAIVKAAESSADRFMAFYDGEASGPVAHFATYSTLFEKWDWIVGFRVDNRNFIGMISSKKSKMNEDIRHTMTTIAFAMVMVIILILILGIHFRLQIENGFQMFTRFFKTASSGYDPIDEKLLWFMEFIKLSRYANRMVDERRKKDKIIGKFTKQLQYANRKLKAMATVDGLTQVPNRRLFDETVVKEWGRAMRDGRPISLGMIDIDFFKVYNDTYGHQKGDECLKKVAKALGDAVKRPSDLLARYGGEEFSLLLPGTDTAGAITIAEIMKRNVADLALAHKGSKVSSQVTFSIGIATMIPLKGSSPESLISQADNALYTAKSRGRDRYEVFEQPV